MSAKKVLYILIGLKGSGKSYTGALIENELGIKFLRVEPIFLKVRRDRKPLDPNYIRDGYIEVEKTIRDEFREVDKLVIESTAAVDDFVAMVDNLKESYEVKLIKINAPMDLCVERVMSRDDTKHIPVSYGYLKIINKLADLRVLPYDLILDNFSKGDNDLIKEISTILS